MTARPSLTAGTGAVLPACARHPSVSDGARRREPPRIIKRGTAVADIADEIALAVAAPKRSPSTGPAPRRTPPAGPRGP
ncbi:hypothetical protein [Streptomyces sp. NPDC008139]|uniref:hypothetical protein n=1 Tax=Streptomyces sp. NPDC008139 TaxID=3364814 RepID=UPI0036E63175